MRLTTFAILLLLISGGTLFAAEPPDWVDAMKAVHSGFTGQKGYVAQYGDSITYSKAFWFPISWDNAEQYLTKDDGLPKRPANQRWRDLIKGCGDKGPEHGNYSGWRVEDVLKAIDGAIARDKPEIALIMVGTNDISAGTVPAGYRPGLKKIVETCTRAHCVPILTTIPPRRGREKAVAEANRIVRDIAKQSKIPLVDFHAECLRLAPGNSWENTLISSDGVHPTGGKANVYTEENIKTSGYALRNWISFQTVREVYFRVLTEPEK